MQHIHTPTLQFEGHAVVWRTIKYLTLAAAGLVAILEHSPILLILLAIAFVLVMALNERINKLASGAYRNPADSGSRLLGDGGSFPGTGPEKEETISESARVLDGGSLEHHRS
jgi:hypothetical protein